METRTATSVQPIVDAFFARMKRRRKADSSIKRWRPELRRYLEWLDGRPLHEIGAREIEFDFLAEWEEQFEERNGRRCSSSSQRSVIQALKSFYTFADTFDFLVDGEGFAFKNPMLKIEQPELEAKSIQWLRGGEDEALLCVNMDLRERFIICFLRYTGMRLDEFLSLSNDDVDLPESTVHVGGRSKTASGLGREIPLNPELVPVIREWFEFTQRQGWYHKYGPLAVTRNLTSMKPQYIETVVKRVALRADVRQGKVTPHTLRRTFGSDLLNRNPPVRLEVVSKLLGHSSTAVTEKAYAQLLNSTIRREMMAAVMAA